MVAYDFSNHSDKAVKYILTKFNDRITEINLCHVIDYNKIVNLPKEELYRYKAEISKKIENYIDDLISNKLNKMWKINYCVDISDDIALSIVDFAKNNSYDLIVVGRRGLSKAEYIFIGSISRKIVERSSIPVLVIP
ncbi:universal stress protein [Sulfolobus sp. S-194]|uniref:universal stress protein n=1 Tax=Sulfolobus sp. S-194 TaxID=2512240 RepID=UPI00143704E5|nr:universal stress protein [Sulfolobus sp. S-194]QIW23961.1 universal stress protein [Sulfolobus sp. S-194]